MTRWLLVVWGSLALAACGDLSNEDLQFAGGTPHARELEIRVAPATASSTAAMSVAQGVVGQHAESYDQAVEIATTVNKVIYGTVDFVDQITHLHHPTVRSGDQRIWGPIANVDGKHFTLRIEVDRSLTTDGKRRWDFCMHVARDAAVTGAGPTSCDDAEKDGLERVLWGHFVPTSKNDSARSGEGQIHVEGRILQKLDPSNESAYLRIDYDFSKGGDDKQLHVYLATTATLSAPSKVSEYDYGKTGKQIDLTLQFQANMVNQSLGVPGQDELVTLTDSWTIDGPGRADGHATGGDLDAGETHAFIECWDASHARTYYKFTFSRHAILNKEEGDVGACPP
jgi:hypothetical protein